MTATAFAPSPQGNLRHALGTPGQLAKIAPASPRPVELLGSLTVNGGTSMTADDAALHELLVSSAYESDRGMNRETATIPMSYVLRYLGTDARREHVKASLGRLRQTTVSFRHDGIGYEDVPLLVHWMRTTETTDDIVYQLPEPLRMVMSDRARYAYIELAALPAMSSTYSSRLYRRLVAAIAESGKTWQAGEDNAVVVEATPEDVATWVSFPRGRDGSLHVGKLRERVLAGLQKDFAAVTAFGFSMTTHAGAGRGRPLKRIAFRLELAAPSRFKTRITYTPEDMRFVGGGDRKDLRVKSGIWTSAQQMFPFAGRKPMNHKDWYELWLAAVEEMESGVPLTRDSEIRVFRGEGLRTKIDLLGADQAAWGFCAEESDSPDIALRTDLRELGAAGRVARKVRTGGLEGSEKAAPVEHADQTADLVEAASEELTAVGFDEASQIHLTIDPALTPQEQDDMVFGPLAEFEFLGRDPKKIVLHFRRKGIWDSYVREDRPTEDCIVALLKLLGRHIEGVQEYRK